MRDLSKSSLIAILFLLLAVAACSGRPAVSEDDRAELAGRLAEIFIEAGSYDRMLDDGADFALPYTVDTLELELGREIEVVEADRVRRILRDTLAELVTQAQYAGILTDVAQENLTARELDSAIGFFRSAEGARFLELLPELSDSTDDRVLALVRGETESFATLVDTRLAELFPELGAEE
jgi:hypothetical protein